MKIFSIQPTLGVWFLLVKISMMSPWLSLVLRLAILPLILAPVTLAPISVWRRKAKSRGREPFGRSIMSPLGV